MHAEARKAQIAGEFGLRSRRERGEVELPKAIGVDLDAVEGQSLHLVELALDGEFEVAEVHGVLLVRVWIKVTCGYRFACRQSRL